MAPPVSRSVWPVFTPRPETSGSSTRRSPARVTCARSRQSTAPAARSTTATARKGSTISAGVMDHPGTSRLFDELARQTGDAEWRAWLCGGGEAVLASGAPERRRRATGTTSDSAAATPGSASSRSACGSGSAIRATWSWRIASRRGSSGKRARTDGPGARGRKRNTASAPSCARRRPATCRALPGWGASCCDCGRSTPVARVKIQLPDSPFP